MTVKAPKYAVGETVMYTGGNPEIARLSPISIAERLHHNQAAGWKYKVPKIDGFTWVSEDTLRPKAPRPAPPPGWALNKLNPVAPEQNPEEIRVMQAIAESAQAQEAAFKAREAMVDAVYAQQEAEERKALEDAEKARVAAVVERLHYEQELAAATVRLLGMVESLTHRPKEHPDFTESLAKFRHELQPLAETYGYAIVPVGDGSRATLSLI